MNHLKRYVVMLDNIEGVTTPKEALVEHVRFLEALEKEGKLEFCGPFSDFPGGMILLKADSLEEAQAIANSDPFVKSGIKAMSIRTWELSCKENNHFGFGSQK